MNFRRLKPEFTYSSWINKKFTKSEQGLFKLEIITEFREDFDQIRYEIDQCKEWFEIKEQELEIKEQELDTKTRVITTKEKKFESDQKKLESDQKKLTNANIKLAKNQKEFSKAMGQLTQASKELVINDRNITEKNEQLMAKNNHLEKVDKDLIHAAELLAKEKEEFDVRLTKEYNELTSLIKYQYQELQDEKDKFDNKIEQVTNALDKEKLYTRLLKTKLEEEIKNCKEAFNKLKKKLID